MSLKSKTTAKTLYKKACQKRQILQSEIDGAIECGQLDSKGLDWLVSELNDKKIDIVDDQDVHDSEELASDDPLGIYLKQVGQIPLLTKKQEQKIFKEIQSLQLKLEKDPENPDLIIKIYALRHGIIQSNLRLVISIAKRYQKLGMSLSDLVAEGNIGLIEAANRFDPTFNVRFSTYGTWWIRQAIIKGLTEKARLVRVPVHILNQLKELGQSVNDLTQSLGREPSFSEIASNAKISYTQLRRILRFANEPGSLEIPVDQSRSLDLKEIIEDKRSISPVENTMLLALKQTIFKILDTLESREREVIILRFGLDGKPPQTLKKTGQSLNITRERTRQIQERALNKIRNCGITTELKDFFTE